MPKITCKAERLKDLFNGISDVRIGQLVKDGLVIRLSRGQYDQDASIKGYIGLLQKNIRNRTELSESEVSAGSYEEHRARLYKARADAAEIRAAMLKGSVLDYKIVLAVVSEINANTRSKFLALPTKSGPLTANFSDPQKTTAILFEAVHECLTELRDLPVEEIVARQLKQPPPEIEAEEMPDKA